MAKTRTIVRYRSRPKARHRKAGLTLPLAAIAGFTPLATCAYNDYRAGGLDTMMAGICARLTGYNPIDSKFNAANLMQGTVPILLGLGVHKVASKMGVNRMLSQAGVPFLRV